mmetsp:Transcript_18430/g.46603  ORF Transcript_18430/g.46603 Transcript_18430/m.46603 type:complete len:214 (+) Transcript_18430:893-1534(+)
MEAGLKGRSSRWNSVEPPHALLSDTPPRCSAARTALSTLASASATSWWQYTADAPACAARRGSTSSGRPTASTRSEPRARSAPRRSATLSRMKRARAGPVRSNPVAALLPYSRGSKQYTGTRLDAPLLAATSASWSCRRRSERSHSSAGCRAPLLPGLLLPPWSRWGSTAGMMRMPTARPAAVATAFFTHPLFLDLHNALRVPRSSPVSGGCW